MVLPPNGEARPGRFRFEREPHHDDYVYRVEDLINLSGKRYHGKRNHVNRFLQEYGDRYIYEAFTPALAQECMELHMQWYRAHRDTGSRGLREECESVERALFNAGALGLVGGVIRVDGKVQAFSMGESITDQMALIHIEKATPKSRACTRSSTGSFSPIASPQKPSSTGRRTWVTRACAGPNNPTIRRA